MPIMTSLLAYLVPTIHKIYTVLAMLIIQRDATTALSYLKEAPPLQQLGVVVQDMYLLPLLP